MLITICVIAYILISCIIGCAIYVYFKDVDEDSDVAGVLGGIFWPFTIVLIILYKIFAIICSNICKVFEYLKNEGFHYCKKISNLVVVSVNICTIAIIIMKLVGVNFLKELID